MMIRATVGRLKQRGEKELASKAMLTARKISEELCGAAAH